MRRKLGNYAPPFKVVCGSGVTQGGPVSAKLFTIMVDVVVKEWQLDHVHPLGHILCR